MSVRRFKRSIRTEEKARSRIPGFPASSTSRSSSSPPCSFHLSSDDAAQITEIVANSVKAEIEPLLQLLESQNETLIILSKEVESLKKLLCERIPPRYRDQNGEKKKSQVVRRVPSKREPSTSPM